MSTTFYRLLLCQIVTLFATAALRFALPLYLLRKTGSAALYGGITAAALVPMLAGTLYGGILADGCRKQTLLAVLNFITALGPCWPPQSVSVKFHQPPSYWAHSAFCTPPKVCSSPLYRPVCRCCCVARHLRRGTPPYSSPTPLMNCSVPCWAVCCCSQ